MKVGDKVSIRGTSQSGVIVEDTSRRTDQRTSVLSFFIVRLESGKELEYSRDELRYFQDESYKKAIR